MILKKKITIGIVFVFILFFSLKTFFSNILFYNSTCGMKNLISEGKIDNLYIGSSMFRQGIDICTLQEELAEESHYILAYNGNQPIWEYMQLEYLLNSEFEIGTLYVDMYAYSICKEPQLDDEKMFLEFPYDKKADIYKHIQTGISWMEKWQLWISSCNEMILFWPIYSKIVDTQFLNGGTLSYSDGSTKEILDSMSLGSYPTVVEDIQKEYVEKIVELANKNGIRIIFVETPKYSKVQYDETYCVLMDDYKEILDSMGVKYVSDCELDCDDAPLFQDLIHLSSLGREKFTQLLCNEIKEGK